MSQDDPDDIQEEQDTGEEEDDSEEDPQNPSKGRLNAARPVGDKAPRSK
jgi:hypothetical protein